MTTPTERLPSRAVSKRRPHLAPWRMAGRASEDQPSADEVVRETGWVFNNETGERLTLDEFVATGTEEVGWYCHHLGLFWGTAASGRTFVEIGSGIGRMTAALTRHYPPRGRVRPRCRLPRALPRNGRAPRHRRASPDLARRGRPDPRPARRERRCRLLLHHAAALQSRRRVGARARGAAGRAPGRPGRRSTSAPGRRRTCCSCRWGRSSGSSGGSSRRWRRRPGS